MQLIVFAEETMLQQGNTHYYNAEMFRRNVVSYLAVNHGIVQSATPFIAPAFLDTLQISMKTDIVVYSVGTKSVSVSLNNNSKVLFFGEDYMVARKEGNQWLLLNGNNAWTDIGIGVGQGEKY